MVSLHGSCRRNQLAPPFVVDLRIDDVAYGALLGLNLEAQNSPLRPPQAPVYQRLPAKRRAHLPRDVRIAVFNRGGGRCVECGADYRIRIDHIIPVSLGGSNHPDNLQVLCDRCNLQKGAKL